MAKSRLKYSLLLAVDPREKIPDLSILNPQPTEIIIKRDLPLAEARKWTIQRASEPYSLVLDVDTAIPNEFLTRGLQVLQEGKYSVCTLMYQNSLQNHPPFGASLWKTERLKEVYDWHLYKESYQPKHQKTVDQNGNIHYKILNPFLCECRYIWSRLSEGELFIFEELKAKHLK